MRWTIPCSRPACPSAAWNLKSSTRGAAQGHQDRPLRQWRRLCRSGGGASGGAGLWRLCGRWKAGSKAGARRGLELFQGRQFRQQGVRRTGGGQPPHAIARRARSPRPDRKRSQCRGPGYAPLRGIPDHEHPQRRQRARRGACPAGRTLAPDPSTTILVNCAGRTRSIIGTQSLINAGLPNRIVALRNGTIGWTLAGQALDHGQSRRFPEPAPGAEQGARGRGAESLLSRRACGGGWTARLSPTWRAMRPAPFTVSTSAPRRNMPAGHIAGFRSAPGGQLVQETDVFAPVRAERGSCWPTTGASAPT